MGKVYNNKLDSLVLFDEALEYNFDDLSIETNQGLLSLSATETYVETSKYEGKTVDHHFSFNLKFDSKSNIFYQEERILQDMPLLEQFIISEGKLESKVTVYHLSLYEIEYYFYNGTWYGLSGGVYFFLSNC